ncbi:cytochrome bc complex cytochrome b subunit [Streptomyces mobaraensis NBRC 13819 = DSM 40847]|uniref:Cytochrome bc1 complex cytochrome b subunit n=1 Tax=Streptomyces mobaraensis (strain ATCC 29032 / DSM 40847 / JCM 4168 / NBRC 13819 / NCIMB 11159 / IPCR 16-22) TaxID=1223523 RepID=M3B678_STRM1|nr:cytochrome bc complex cytochrome b subunit [Streptomyces mobaraensis]EMF01488.1 ubiquinol-cytochrome C reductase cytochrome subunit B [Streptomyces mobaraensis NBRC 13819 = DSM 40847]QTT76815.1 cytochrome bc complex cytochrome b subunit [Streptomyces mobaraensis NBRC 13819 = DSM 40847]
MLVRKRKARIEARAREAAVMGYTALDRRAPVSEAGRQLLRKAFPDHWSFLLGELALYSFVVLVLTGSYLTLFFSPSMTEGVYDGSYGPLRGLRVSDAYASTLHISFDVRGGLLIRQTHHWAALVFVAALGVHLLRVFFTGAFRRPRELNWAVGVTLFLLALLEGFCGYSLPDDLLSGTGMRTAYTIVTSIPVAGTYLGFLLWGGSYPGHSIVHRLYAVHVYFVPLALLALVGLHLVMVVYLKHTQWSGRGRTNRNVVGQPMVPQFATKSAGLCLMVSGVLVVLGGVAQINPVWDFGPYRTDQVSTDAQPDWYVGFLEGALRLMPPWENTVAGHTLMWNVLVPAVLLPALLFLLLYLYPFFERWITGDLMEHHVCDRPRDRPVRTALGVAALVCYAVLLAAGGNDVTASVFRVSVETLTWIFRVALVAGPVLAFMVAKRACLALQAHDRRLLEEGEESGVVGQSASGGLAERHRPLDAAHRYRLLVRDVPPPLAHPGEAAPRRERLRAALSAWFSRDRVDMPATDEQRLQVTGRTAGPLPPAEE